MGAVECGERTIEFSHYCRACRPFLPFALDNGDFAVFRQNEVNSLIT